MDRRVERVHCTKSKIAELRFGAFLVPSVSWAGSHEGTEQGPSRKKGSAVPGRTFLDAAAGGVSRETTAPGLSNQSPGSLRLDLVSMSLL